MRVYVAGPMSGLPDLNYPAFHAAAERLRALGYEVENPAENPEPDPLTWENYMRMAITQLCRCDTLALLPGWEKSRGATIEHQIAGWLHIPRHYADSELFVSQPDMDMAGRPKARLAGEPPSMPESERPTVSKDGQVAPKEEK